MAFFQILIMNWFFKIKLYNTKETANNFTNKTVLGVNSAKFDAKTSNSKIIKSPNKKSQLNLNLKKKAKNPNVQIINDRYSIIQF